MKIPLQLSIVFLVLTICPGVTLAQDSPANVRGRISTLWGEPIGEAEVAFYELEGIRGISAAEKLVGKTVTDKLGDYRINGLPFGQYRVDVNLAGFGHSEVWRFYLWRGANRVLDIGIPVGYTHSLAPIIVSGSVQQRDKASIEGATVTLVNAFDSTESQQARTNKAGRFQFDLIQPGQYVIYASKPGFLIEAATVDLGNGTKETVGIVLKSAKPKYMKTH